MDLTKKYYFLSSNCFAVTGYTRAILYDLQRHNLTFAPNEMAKFVLEDIRKYSINDLELVYKDQIDIFLEYIDLLKTKDVIVEINEQYIKNFVPIELDWDCFSVISNAIINYGRSANLSKILKEIANINCKAICIRYNEYHDFIFSLEQLQDIQLSIINAVDIDINLSVNDINKFMVVPEQILNRLRLIRLFGTSHIEKINLDNSIKNIFVKTINNRLSFSNFSYRVYENEMIISIPMFTESQKHNTYFNRKLSIDENGYIKNSPELEWHYGHIDEISLSDAINDMGTDKDFFKKYAHYKRAKKEGKEYELDFEKSKPAFNALYFIYKELIDVCKECEFRHMCVDAAVPLQREDNSWYRSVECNYNPYICKWEGEDGYLNLAACGVKCDIDGFEIDHEKIAVINQELWGEDE